MMSTYIFFGHTILHNHSVHGCFFQFLHMSDGQLNLSLTNSVYFCSAGTAEKSVCAFNLASICGLIAVDSSLLATAFALSIQFDCIKFAWNAIIGSEKTN